jgi:hypothetical protein
MEAAHEATIFHYDTRHSSLSPGLPRLRVSRRVVSTSIRMTASTSTTVHRDRSGNRRLRELDWKSLPCVNLPLAIVSLGSMAAHAEVTRGQGCLGSSGGRLAPQSGSKRYYTQSCFCFLGGIAARVPICPFGSPLGAILKFDPCDFLDNCHGSRHVRRCCNVPLQG